MAHALGAVYDTPHGVANAILLPTVMAYNAAFVMYPSIACVRASIPVDAVRPYGILLIISGSTIATTGISLGSTQTNLRCFSSSLIT